VSTWSFGYLMLGLHQLAHSAIQITHTLSLLATLWNCVLHSGWNVKSYIKQ